MFHINWTITVIVFLLLARKWPKLLHEWSEVDAAMRKNYGYPINLDRRLRITAFVLILLAAGLYVREGICAAGT